MPFSISVSPHEVPQIVLLTHIFHSPAFPLCLLLFRFFFVPSLSFPQFSWKFPFPLLPLLLFATPDPEDRWGLGGVKEGERILSCLKSKDSALTICCVPGLFFAGWTVFSGLTHAWLVILVLMAFVRINVWNCAGHSADAL